MIGKKLKALRVAAGIGEADMASRLGIRLAELRRMEAEAQDVPVSLFVRWAGHLGQAPAALLGGPDDVDLLEAVRDPATGVQLGGLRLGPVRRQAVAALLEAVAELVRGTSSPDGGA